MQTIYHIGYAGYLDATQEVPIAQRAIPAGWTRTAPPPIPDGHYAVFTGRGWMLTDEPPPEPPPPPLTDVQQFGIEASQREIDSIIQGRAVSDLEIRLLMGGL